MLFQECSQIRNATTTRGHVFGRGHAPASLYSYSRACLILTRQTHNVPSLPGIFAGLRQTSTQIRKTEPTIIRNGEAPRVDSRSSGSKSQSNQTKQYIYSMFILCIKPLVEAASFPPSIGDHVSNRSIAKHLIHQDHRASQLFRPCTPQDRHLQRPA